MMETVLNNKLSRAEIRRMPPVGKKRILIVEDEEPVRELLAILFSSEVVVDIAKDGQEGLEKATRQRYDLILSDIDMPVMSGIEFYQQVALHDAGISERFLFLTGLLRQENLDFAKKEKIGYFLKPFSPKHIKEIVYGMLMKAEETRPRYL